MNAHTDTCPYCGATQPGLPPGVQTSTQRHCSRGCGRYFTVGECAGGCGADLDYDMGPYCPECQHTGRDPEVGHETHP